MIEFIQTFAGPLVGGVVSGCIAWGMQRTEIRYLRRDVDELRRIVLKTL